MKELNVLAPGRITLFGEHQDYLGLPVIPVAINRFIRVKGYKIQNEFEIALPDIKEKKNFKSTNLEINYNKRDYLTAGVKVLQDEGIIDSTLGAKVQINGDIPLQVGLSSSSAMISAKRLASGKPRWITPTSARSSLPLLASTICRAILFNARFISTSSITTLTFADFLIFFAIFVPS